VSKKIEKSKLDLHGIKHEDVRSKLIRFIEDLWQTDTAVEIITGHSPEMKSIVIEVLREYKLEYNDGGVLGVNPAIITTVIP
jgi:DNA-nicking Smr family endonuclease